jgi:hypothetical protein
MNASAVASPSLIALVEMPRSWIDSAHKEMASWFAYSVPRVERPVSQIGDGDVGASLALPPSVSSLAADGCEFDTNAVLAMFEFAPTRMAAFAVIDDFADLPPAWGGPDTVLPSVETRAAAKALLMGLPSTIATPHVSPSADGEIGFTWATATKRVDALLDADGHLVWFWARRDSRINPGDEVTYDGAFPDDLLAVLESP